MENKYCNNYLQAITKGMTSVVTSIDHQDVSLEDFFNILVKKITNLQNNNGKLIFLGNGASSAFSNHMALDFSKNGKILARSLSDSALLTALSNDYSYENAMLEFLKIEGATQQDLVITISSSGNSPNILNVLSHCKENKIKTYFLS